MTHDPITLRTRPAVNHDAESVQQLRDRIECFVRSASIEIMPSDESRMGELAELLPPNTTVYVAHVPRATLQQVIRAALAVQSAGFTASPHIVARRLSYPHTLRKALEELCAGGVKQILLVAGDLAHATGEFEDTLDVFNSGIIEASGITRIGVAGHPEGQQSIGHSLLWEALRTKQEYANRTGIKMHLVSQFSLHVQAVVEWEPLLQRNGITLPIHVGIAGPTSLSKLIKFAMLCGIGNSLRSIMRNLSIDGNFTPLATRPDQHLMHLMQMPPSTRIVQPHFYSFGDVLETARWMKRVVAGEYHLELGSDHFTMHY